MSPDAIHHGDAPTHIDRGPIWRRAGWMLAFALAWQVAAFALFAVAVFQLGAMLFTGRPLDNLRDFASSLSRFIGENAAFLSFTTEERPFPIGRWPSPRAPHGGE